MFNGKGSGTAGGEEGLTVIGAEARFHGVLNVKGSIRIEGCVEGDVTDATSVEIGKGGRVKGNVVAEVLSVAGEIVGDVTAARSVELLKDCRVQGRMKTPRLRIDDGAVFNGQCAMSSEAGFVDAELAPQPQPRRHEAATAGHK
ncbi:MAG: polymer-forming cytoskeletal protein [Elusimicrobia bacterium]|nr:polymer-forming cytoskeletal protein [Elusimicrobiota bacterium]